MPANGAECVSVGVWTSTRITDTPSRQDCTFQKERVSSPRCEFIPVSFASLPSVWCCPRAVPVLSPCCLSVASWSLDPRSGPGPWHALSTRCTVGSATNGGRGERRLSMRRARNEGSPSAGEPWCGSMQSRVKSTAHRRSRASFRNLVSPLIATRFRESCRSAESVRNMYKSTVQQLRGVRTRIRRRQIFLSVT